MRFISTRDDANPPREYTLEEAVLKGWADDGGMLMPIRIPAVDLEDLADLSYKELSVRILKLFTSSSVLTEDEIEALVGRAFERFDIDEVVRLREIEDESPLYVAELWHGPTLAFKDLSMQVLCEYIELLLAKRGERLNLLVGTSGDTGASCIAAVLGKDRLSCTVLYPSRRFSSITSEQEFETVCHAREANVRVVCCEGTSDDLDVPIEACFRDGSFAPAIPIGSVNSVNVMRVIMQVVHYFYAFFRVRESHGQGERVSFCVPTGAAGHISAGILAAQMGLPMASLVACVNENDVLHTLVSGGELDSTETEVVRTLAPSMDIKVPYNTERILFLLTNQNRRKVREWMTGWKRNGKVSLKEEEREALATKLRLRSATTKDEAILATIARVYRENPRGEEGGGYVLDPHTAVAVAACLGGQGGPGAVVSGHTRVCMGCAHPVKFSETVSEALGGLAPAKWVPSNEAAHPAVRSILELLESRETADLSAKPGVRALRKGEDWTAKLRTILESM